MISRAYNLPKVYKMNFPLRLIVSSINSPLYDLSFFFKIIKKSILEVLRLITNRFQLVQSINEKPFEDNYVLASLDVVSFLTIISTDLAVWKELKRDEIILVVQIFRKKNF